MMTLGLKFKRLSWVLILAFLLWPALALADNVVQGFKAQGSLELGEVVSLTSDGTAVEASPANLSNSIYGVVIDPSKAALYLSGTGKQVYVANTGDYPVLVDNQNGPIKVGDHLSISSTSGVAAKASADQPYVLGQAVEAFDGTQNVVGHDGKFAKGKITVSIFITRSPLFKNSLAIPEPLQKIGNAIAGREAPPLKIYTALIIFVVASALTVILLAVGIRGGMTAIGRNPLSRHLILRGLFEVIGAGVVIFFSSLLGVYLLLRL